MGQNWQPDINQLLCQTYLKKPWSYIFHTCYRHKQIKPIIFLSTMFLLQSRLILLWLHCICSFIIFFTLQQNQLSLYFITILNLLCDRFLKFSIFIVSLLYVFSIHTTACERVRIKFHHTYTKAECSNMT